MFVLYCRGPDREIVARRLPWFHARAPGRARAGESPYNPVSGYPVPFLAILAAGMAVQAATGTFEWLYPLRLFSALGALWLFRRRYANLDWRFGWFAAGMGVAAFPIWIGLERFTAAANASRGMPAALAGASPGALMFRVSLRVLAATVTVPIAEELAFRGFLMRRFISADFENVRLEGLAGSRSWPPPRPSAFCTANDGSPEPWRECSIHWLASGENGLGMHSSPTSPQTRLSRVTFCRSSGGSYGERI